MIGLDMSGGIVLYLVLWLVAIAFLWIRELLRARRAEQMAIRGRLFTCDKCRNVFLYEDTSNITRCPRCNSMCILRKKRGL